MGVNVAAADKVNLIEKLVELGWTEVDDSEYPYHLEPPADLWLSRPDEFHVYQAQELQNMLGEPVTGI